MNHSQCFPSSTSTPQFSPLQLCTEGLPLVLQKPDSFPRVMGILHEIKQEKVSFVSSGGNVHRSPIVANVKKESADSEIHHQSLNSDLCPEWSLKGVEEFLAEPEELNVGQDCFQQLHGPAVTHLDECALDEKPLIGLHPALSQHDWEIREEEIKVDIERNPMSENHLVSSFPKELILQDRESQMDVNSNVLRNVSVPKAQSDGNHTWYSPITSPFQICTEDRQGLKYVHSLKREPEEVEAQIQTCTELQTRTFGELNRSGFSWDAMESDPVTKISHCLLQGSGQMKSAESYKLEMKPELQNIVSFSNTVQRDRSPSVALPAESSDIKKNKYAEESSQCPSAEAVIAVENGSSPSAKSRLIASAVESDECELTLSLASSKTRAGDPDCLSRPLYLGDGYLNSFNVDARSHSDELASMSKDVDCCNLDLNSKESGNMVLRSKNGQLLSEKNDRGERTRSDLKVNCSRRTLECKTRTSDGGGLHLEEGKTNGDERVLHLEERKRHANDGLHSEEGKTAGSDDLAQPTPAVTIESSPSSQGEEASEVSEPIKKKMRGTLPIISEKADSTSKDTRCHRSDGKSWRCVRECINGAYYCQYHLRKRRIGYNRRKNREVNSDDFEVVNKATSRSNRKCR
ncbi:hypothetical protein KP509_31G058200 [Ceratopteris richardii]|uniref:WRC domain-containing protein n=2 Tax=Ceratopteris richardii TaxID=49495 RepID=A0A8T2QZ44_CERRI|nr:hypothetical protein KP509_31G058200 [Ceratopteris richardii]KAH7289108.1 hypothetical protein KP509_31G058200 [Ceratopteris richardii]